MAGPCVIERRTVVSALQTSVKIRLAVTGCIVRMGKLLIVFSRGRGHSASVLMLITALQVMTENARKTNFLATVLQIMTGIAVRTDHKLQGYVELTDIEKSASVLKRAQQKLVANAQVCRAQVSCTLLTNHFATLHRITVNVLGISYFCRIYKCRNTNDCSMSCPVGKTASCILKKLGSECVCIDDNYCTTNGTELCPFAMFSGASFATYHRYCSDNQSRIPRLCRADRNREECNCAPGCYYTSDCDDGTQATCDTGMHIECINTTCMCHKECSDASDCTCSGSKIARCNWDGSCSCETMCQSNEECTAHRKCPPGRRSWCSVDRVCSPCRLECNADLDCFRANCSANTPYKKCINHHCECLQCMADSDCASHTCPTSTPYKCLETSQCSDCTGSSRKLCSRGGDSKCLHPYGCERNSDCDRSNSYGCSFISLAPACCFRDCQGINTCQCSRNLEDVLGCRGGADTIIYDC
ncbi:protein kinase C-binding protein NELL1 isoform X2 [Folsomia candida]|uniref:protein kinase C-binding protein NELL1 isoform X2 n=1 Tax=Folsomia candida TaxID=158441 RepID=UPI0016052E1B|nr:protein kinase C-binding protein NELL1 isoform X2 [Folsomia candida]